MFLVDFWTGHVILESGLSYAFGISITFPCAELAHINVTWVAVDWLFHGCLAMHGEVQSKYWS